MVVGHKSVWGLLWKLPGVQDGVRGPIRDPCLVTFPRWGCVVGDLSLSTLTPLSLGRLPGGKFVE